MTRATLKERKDLAENLVERLEKENALLKLYFWDTVGCRPPDAHSSEGSYGATMYRCTGGHGGYVVIRQFGFAGVPQLVYLDEINPDWPADIRIIADRFRVQRQKLCEQDWI